MANQLLRHCLVNAGSLKAATVAPIYAAFATQNGHKPSFLRSNLANGRFDVQSSRGTKTWYPDREYIEQFQGHVLFPDELKWSKPLPPLTEDIQGRWKSYTEKHIRNVLVNFGPQHPAAHGVLRWEIGEKIKHLFLQLMKFSFILTN